jgi:voltage-gated potassium channel
MVQEEKLEGGQWLLIGLVVITLLVGTVFYHYVESLIWLDAFYFSVVSLTTVGYGDISPQTSFGKLFTVFYLLIGIGLLFSFISLITKRRLHKHSKNLKK